MGGAGRIRQTLNPPPGNGKRSKMATIRIFVVYNNIQLAHNIIINVH